MFIGRVFSGLEIRKVSRRLVSEKIWYLCQSNDGPFEGFWEVPVSDGQIDFVPLHLDLVLSVGRWLILRGGDKKSKLS